MTTARSVRKALGLLCLGQALALGLAVLVLALWPAPGKYPWGALAAVLVLAAMIGRYMRARRTPAGVSPRGFVVGLGVVTLLDGWTLWHWWPPAGVRPDWIGDVFGISCYALLLGFALLTWTLIVMTIKSFIRPRLRRWIDESDARAQR